METDAFGRPLSQDPRFSNSTGRRPAPENTIGADGFDSTLTPEANIRVAIGVDEDGGFLRLGDTDPLKLPLRTTVATTIRDLMEHGGDRTVLDTLIRAMNQPVLAEDDAILAALAPYRWILERARDGLPLTTAGYLKPADVTTLADLLPAAKQWFGKKNREDHTRPVAEFRQMMMRFRLLRKYKGTLRLTAHGKRALADPQWLWHWLGLQVLDAALSGAGRDAIIIDLVFTAAGRRAKRDFVAGMLTMIGWRFTDGSPIDEWSVLRLTDPYAAVMTSLGEESWGFLRDKQVSLVERTFALNAITLPETADFLAGEDSQPSSR
ncbi:MAG: hypothetical protein LBV06_00300 [Propionibacteriaceae bacterium]|jgi:hypothetical protein|nr:hypothetical protein [Propionibacteriaceae bacterium]